jgi:hypothetical protein
VNLVGQLARVYFPEPLRRLLLTRLFQDTAAAFGRPVPPLRGLPAEQILRAFAEFTARTPVEESTSAMVSERLFHVAYRYGRWLRRAFRVASPRDVMDAACVVYRTLGIDFEGGADGEISISRCAFSGVYTPGVCQRMSALDAGLLAGLSGGRRLIFSERITAGYPRCRAQLVNP